MLNNQNIGKAADEPDKSSTGTGHKRYNHQIFLSFWLTESDRPSFLKKPEFKLIQLHIR